MDIASILQSPVDETSLRTRRSADMSTSTSPIPSPHSGCRVVKSSFKSKRTQTKAACLKCRQRKSKCDGNRPSCKTCAKRNSKCEYSVEEGKTQQQAIKEQLKSYKQVLALLRDSSPKEGEAILHILKNMELNDACRFILDGCVSLPNR